MRDMGTKESIDNIWERYAKTLKLLSNALEELEKKPKEVIIEKLVEVEKVVEDDEKNQCSKVQIHTIFC